MTVMDRFTFRSMMKNRKWTAVTLIGIIISTAMLSAVSTLCASFQHLLVMETIDAWGNWHASVAGVPAEMVSAFEDASFVGEVFVTQDLGYSPLPEGSDKLFLFVQGVDIKGLESLPIALIEGRLPQGQDEIVIPRHLLLRGGASYSVGDSITLDLGHRLSPSGAITWQDTPYEWGDGDSPGETWLFDEKKTYIVVGIMEPYGLERAHAAGYTAVTSIDRGTLARDDKVTVSVRAKKLRKSFYVDMEGLVDSLGLGGHPIEYNRELIRFQGVIANDSFQNSIYSLAAIFISIIMVASVSLIYNAFAISVSERVSQLGMLASVGATRRQKRRSVYYEGFLLGLVGIPLGNAAGIAGIGVTLSAIRPLLLALTDMTSSQWEFKLHVSLASIIVTSILAAITIAVSAWIPARRASRITPIEAIRQTKDLEVTAKSVRTSRISRFVFGLEGDLARKNLGRNRKKRRATVLSLVISLVLFLTVSYLAGEIALGSKALETGVNFDIAVTYRGMSKEEANEASERTIALDGVTGWTSAQMGYGNLWADPDSLSALVRKYAQNQDMSYTVALGTTFYSMDDASFLAFAEDLGVDATEYRDPKNPKVIIVNYGQAMVNDKIIAGEVLSMTPGTQLRFSAGDDPERGFDMALGVLTDKRPMGVPISALDSVFVLVGSPVFESLSQSVKSINAEGNPDQQYLFLTCDDPLLLEGKVYEAGHGDKRILVNVTAKTARMERDFMFVVGVFVYGFITLISLICTANILNTVTTNIALRRREFAMLRSVGMTPSSFAKMIRYESIFYGLEALLWGLPLGAGLSYLMYRAVRGGFDSGFRLPWKSYAAAIILVFGIVGVTMLWSSSRVRKENIVDALRADAF